MYGGDKFQDRVVKLLDSQSVDNYKVIDTLDMIEDLIKNEPKQYFLIDEDKIYEPNIIYKWLKFLQPKDGINSTLLKENGHYDINFSSIENATRYISLQQSINTQNQEEPNLLAQDDESLQEDEIKEEDGVEINEESEVLEDVEETPEPRDLTTITDLEDIDDSEMQEAILDTQIN